MICILLSRNREGKRLIEVMENGKWIETSICLVNKLIADQSSEKKVGKAIFMSTEWCLIV